MKRLTYILALTIFCSCINAQYINGTIYSLIGSKKEPVEGAVIKWINTTIGTMSDSQGRFELESAGVTDKRFVVSHVGFLKDTLEADRSTLEIVLRQKLTTGEIDVEDEKRSTYFDNFNTKTEIITSNELVKDACCDLSGCFGRNSSVDVAVTDILTDSKELKVLGLEGFYTQVLLENMPVITGLNTKYSLSSVPGTLIDKIMVTKGANSVLQGYENISGIINVLLKDSKTSDRLLINAFMNSMFEKQFNTNLTHEFNNKLNSILTFHTTQKSNRIDDNNDGFLDNPLVTRYMVFNKWRYGDDEDKTQFLAAGKLWFEERIGGQKSFDPNKDKGSNSIYGQTVNIKSGDLYSRFSRHFKNDNSLKVLLSGNHYDISSFYGTTRYAAKQNVYNGSIIYEFEIGIDNFLKTGVSYKYERTDEIIDLFGSENKTYAGKYLKTESVPGIFAEHSINIFDEKATLMTGIRYDYHNEHKGIITPRVLLRYQPVLETVIRASIGTGFRTVELFNEYSSIMASSKDIVLTEKLEPEKMLNYGIDLLQYFDLSSIAGSLNIDLYRTEFNNKVIPDYDSDPSRVYFSNSRGRAYSNILQVELNMNIMSHFEVKSAYKFIEIRYNENGKMADQPFNSKHRLLTTLSYMPKDKSWGVNLGMQWFGKSRLPSTATNPIQYQRMLESEPYTLISAQLNRNFKLFEIYAGAENLLNFKQENPIISADDPFGQYFDTSFIWGPTKGREFYAGLRLRIN